MERIDAFTTRYLIAREGYYTKFGLADGGKNARAYVKSTQDIYDS